MRNLGKRVADLEALPALRSGKPVYVFKWESWTDEQALDDHGRERISPDDEVRFVVWGDMHMPPEERSQSQRGTLHHPGWRDERSAS